MSTPSNDQVIGALGGLLGALVGGHPEIQNHMDQSGKDLDQVLGPLSNHVPSKGRRRKDSGASGADALGSILTQVVNGGSQDSGGNLLTSVLGGLNQSGSASGGLDQVLSSVLGNVLSGHPAGGGTDPIGSLVGSLLGTGTGGVQGRPANSPLANTFVQPIADMLVQKTGMDRKVANVVVVFALTTLLSAATQKAAHKGLDVSDLVNQLSSGSEVSQSYLNNSGLAAELSKQSGLDPQTSAQSLQQVFAALGTQMGHGSMQDRKTALKSHLKKQK